MGTLTGSYLAASGRHPSHCSLRDGQQHCCTRGHPQPAAAVPSLVPLLAVCAAARSELRHRSQLPYREAGPSRHPAGLQHVLRAASSSPYPADDGLELSFFQAPWQATCHSAQVLLKFSRPHTLLGTLISVNSVSLLALGSCPITPVVLAGLLQALVAALLMNVCIVGINQLYDVEIDRINKPYLPLASGELSMQGGLGISVATGTASLALGLLSGSQPLLWTLAGSLILGIAYSVDLPWLRWKRHPLAAASCILAVRAVLVQLGFYGHMKQVLGVTPTVTRPLAFATGFMLLFSIVIALFKDIPDVKGDVHAGLKTLSVRRGVPSVFWTCIVILELAYVGGVAMGLFCQIWWSQVLTVVVHLAMGVSLLQRARATDLTSSTELYSCYMHVWKLFYAEYLILPLLR